MNMRPGFATKFAFLNGGLIIWAAHFLFVYGVNGIVCARAPLGVEFLGGTFMPWVVLVATVFGVAASCAVALLALAGRGPGIAAENDLSLREFWRFTTMIIAGLAVVAIVWTAVPILFIRPCS
jgi:hypothetical protein